MLSRLNGHTPEDIEGWVRDITVGRRAAVALEDETNPLTLMLTELREKAAKATLDLIHVDLFDDEGLREARRLQNDIHRYLELVNIVGNVLDAAEVAETQAAEHEVEEAAVQIVQEQLYGTREHPSDL